MSIEIQDGIQLNCLDAQGLLEVRIPVRWPKMKGRKTMAVPGSLYRDRAEPAVREALVQAHRCQNKLLKGEAGSVKELAQKEKIDKSQLSKTLRLTSLAPEIQKDILHEIGCWPLTVQQVMQPFPLAWHDQVKYFTSLIHPES